MRETYEPRFCWGTQWSISLGPARGTGLAGGQYRRPAQGLWQRAGALRRWTLVLLNDRAGLEGSVDRSLEAHRMNKASGPSVIAIESLIETLVSCKRFGA